MDTFANDDRLITMLFEAVSWQCRGSIVTQIQSTLAPDGKRSLCISNSVCSTLCQHPVLMIAPDGEETVASLVNIFLQVKSAVWER